MLTRWQLEQARKIFTDDGVIAYPTESVYGLGCHPFNSKALAKILQIKQRPAKKGLIILVSDINQASPFITKLSNQQLAFINQPRDRATTWLIPRQPQLSELLCGQHAKIAVRVTTHPIAKQLCDYFGSALVSTSCNRQGKSEMKTKNEVRNKMGTVVDLIIKGDCGQQAPSQIIDLETGRVLRQ
jgi:L-threonylcarbamoyladenylate synthase